MCQRNGLIISWIIVKHTFTKYLEKGKSLSVRCRNRLVGGSWCNISPIIRRVLYVGDVIHKQVLAIKISQINIIIIVDQIIVEKDILVLMQ